MRSRKPISPEVRARRRQARACQAFLLAALSCFLGVVFCVVKSPQARSEAYMAAAVEALAQRQVAEAAAAAKEAVRLNPASPQGWQLLSRLLRENGQGQAAKQAQVIAARLQQNPDAAPPLYAMPAELRLSLLTLSETGLQ